jgi:hypothetical protein
MGEVVAEELVPWDGAVNRRVVADWLIGGEGREAVAALVVVVTKGRRGDGAKETVHHVLLAQSCKKNHSVSFLLAFV